MNRFNDLPIDCRGSTGDFFTCSDCTGVPATVSGAAPRYALAKNTSDRWRPGPGTGVSERKEMMKKRKKEGWRRSGIPEGAEENERGRERRTWVVDGRETSGTTDPEGPNGLKEDETRVHTHRSFPREEWRWTRGRKRQRVRRGNRWMGLAAYPANAPSDIAVTPLWRARGYDALVVKSGISVPSSIRLSSRLKIRSVFRWIRHCVWGCSSQISG